MFCSNCGNKIEKCSSFCTKCGSATGNVAMNNQPVYYYGPKVPGNGLSIAGMVLGIVGISLALFYLLGVASESYILEKVMYRRYVFAYAFGVVLIPLALSATGLPLSICGLLKNKNGKNIAGIILNSITLLIQFILFIYIVVTFS